MYQNSKLNSCLIFLYVKNGESLYSHKRHHWSYLIRRWLSVLGWTLVSAGECRAVVRHTFDQRLRNRKCNHRWDIRENVGREMLPNVAGRLNYSRLLRVPPARGRGASRVILSNATFGLDLLLGLKWLKPRSLTGLEQKWTFIITNHK